jgi:hypothetical protein
MDYLVKIRSVQTPINGQFSIGANTRYYCINIYNSLGIYNSPGGKRLRQKLAVT